MPNLKYLQPAQYESWLRKVDDPDVDRASIRHAKDNGNEMQFRELRDAFNRIEELENR